jgi:imidazolonepropionase-like amidohydrolase
MTRIPRSLGAALAALLVPLPLAAGSDAGVHAITGARIVVAPGETLESGTVVMRDGIIEAVGAAIAVPADARLWPGEGLTLYPGLIDLHVEPEKRGEGRTSRPEGERPERSEPEPQGAEHALAAVRAQQRAAEQPPPSAERRRALREAGFTAALLVPGEGVLRGTGALVSLGDGTLGENALVADAAQVVSFDTSRGAYPGSRMGAVAVVRQSLLDAVWYAESQAAWQRGERAERPPLNLAWAALAPLVERRLPAAFVVEDVLAALRAAAILREAPLDAWIVGAADGYERSAALAATGLPVVAPLAFPEAPKLKLPGDEADVETALLRHWQAAPGNPAALRRAGIELALTGHGLASPAETRRGLARAIAAGLSEADALAGLTAVPARSWSTQMSLTTWRFRAR